MRGYMRTGVKQMLKIEETEPPEEEVLPIGFVAILQVADDANTLFGYGTWTVVGSGRVLVGLDSGQTEFDTLGETGGAKTHTLVTGEMPSHTHVQDSHNHTQDSHNHTQDAHTHVQDAHTHVQDAHTHVQNAHNHVMQRFPTATGASTGFTVDTSMSGTPAAANNTADTTAVNQNATAVNQNATAVNQNATATNQAATATNQAATATNQNTGGGAAHNNLQPYLVVKFWARTA